MPRLSRKRNTALITIYRKHLIKFGAGEENRTLDQSLEGSCFTTKLHPQI